MAFFLGNSSYCQYCSVDCSECEGSANSCKTCPFALPDLQNNTCTSTEAFVYFAQDFFSGNFDFSTWNVYPFLELTKKTCDHDHDHIEFIGGDSFLDKDSSITKSLNNLLSHYKIRLSFYVYAIGEWNIDDKFIIKVDQINTEYTFTPSLNSSYNQDCGDSKFLKSEGTSTQCKTCLTGSFLTAGQCSKNCSTNQYFYSGDCLNDCPNSLYADSILGACVAKCSNSLYKYVFDKKCYEICVF